ncbi:DUF6797 domain-containing protein [Prosthecobacter sp. SYSU 5D2]|uniref:DUF6797 domain-containing protein n=1 Tax=Prosthecobacter sp. SYSU 5D2 TaxID=3134134 RepID=UPI0031FEFC2E
MSAKASPKINITPCGLILNIGHNFWTCFDTDLLRISAIWEGEEDKALLTPDALAPGSYHIAGQKTKDGQEYLPKPVGNVWLTTGIYPGWQIGEKPSFTDPLEPGPSLDEVGRGGLSGSSFSGMKAGGSGILSPTGKKSLLFRDTFSFRRTRNTSCSCWAPL